MVFESLTERLQNVFKIYVKKEKYLEADVQEATKEIRLACCHVAFAYCATLRRQNVQSDTTLNPAQQIIKCWQELTAV